jgi:hypothetical protein
VSIQTIDILIKILVIVRTLNILITDLTWNVNNVIQNVILVNVMKKIVFLAKEIIEIIQIIASV